MTDTASVPARRGGQADKSNRPISFRPTIDDRSRLEAIRKALPWIASDADALRYGLYAATEKTKGRRA